MAESVAAFIDELAANMVATRMWQDNLLRIAERATRRRERARALAKSRAAR